ncbi:MAG: exodeoxyribonuclease III [Caulobacterales bacterium]
MSLRIASYNVNGINSRFDVLSEWLLDERPDIVCLQELKAPQEKFPRKDLAALGYHSIWQGQSQWNGVAILSREPLEERRRGLPGDPKDLHSRYIEASVGDMVIGCLYAPNGNPAPGPKFEYKLKWFARLQKHARALLKSEAPVILAGDYNVMPTDLDVYAPERWRDDALFRPEVRDAYATLLDQGWTDALRSVFGDERVYTFWKYWRRSFERNSGLRIDHLLLSPSMAGRLKGAGVSTDIRAKERTSDHAPVWIELRDVPDPKGDSRARRVKRLS